MIGRTAASCATCGRSVAVTDRFCPYCGADLSALPSITDPSSPAPDSSPWDDVVDRLRKATEGEFQILRELGRGGMAAVYLAHDLALNRRVAIKVMSPGLLIGPGMVERFRQEAITVANLSHPHIVTMYSVRQALGLEFFVMKLIAGQSLDRVVARLGPLPVPVVQAILFQVGSALAYAHRRGVVHRDIKPGNILFDEDGNAMVTDFGISKAAQAPSTTMSGVTVGTPAYMSPEQCWSREVTGASDQYALGVVAYEMLAGRPPFQGPTLAILRAHTEDAPPRLRDGRPDIPEAIAAAVERMLAKEPEARFPDVAQAVAALGGRHLAEGDPIRDWLARLGPDDQAIAGEMRTPGAALPSPPPKRTGAAAPEPSVRVRVGSATPATPAAPRAAQPAPRIGLLERIVARLTRHRREPPARVSPEDVGVTDEQPVAMAPAGGEFSTQPVRAQDWAPTMLEKPAAAKPSDASTQVLAAPGSESARPLFPVALSVTASPDPSQLGIKLRCDHFPFTVGRAPACDLCVPGDTALSRTHCQIDRDDSGFLIRDLSTNGVFVNGRLLQGQAEPIPFGARIALSKLTALMFVADVPMLPPLRGQIIAGRYRLEELVHQSVKAATYVAKDLRIPQSVTAKLFSPSLMQLAAYRSEFERQATLAARLQHPHICKVLDFGDTALTVGGRSQQVAYLCTYFMAGGNLQTRLEAGPSQPALVARWIEKVADALEHAHRHGVIHGDLKPTCIVFDADGTPYLTDFALARGGETATRSVLGTPEYLAPEQWDGEPPSAASDQYSLAVLTYLMVTGTRPHEGQSDPAVRARNFRHGPPLAHKEAGLGGRDPVSQRCSLVLAKGMSVNAADRYGSVAEFSAALTDAIAHPDRRTGEPRIFMSYHRESSAGWANLLALNLKQRHGYSVFIDTQAQDGAPQIPDRLRNEIAGCDVFVCMLAPRTLTSRWVCQEIEIAHQCHKPMVPVFHEDFRPKDQTEGVESGVQALLDYAAVHLLDRRNIHVEHTIAELAEQVHKLLG